MNRHIIISLIVILSACVAMPAASQNRFARMGDEAFEAQLYQVAAERYKKAYKKTKDKSQKKRIAMKLAESYRMSQNLRRAKGQYARLIRQRMYEETPDIFLKYGHILLMLDEREEAEKAFIIYDSLVGSEAAAIAIESVKFGRRVSNNPNNYSVENIRKINSRYDDFSPAYQDRNYQSLYFTSTRDESFGKDTDGWTGEKFSDIFFSKIDRQGNWTKPEPIDEEQIINTKSNEGQAAFNSRFSRMYFTRCFVSPKRPCGCLVLMSKRSGRHWGEPEVIDLQSDSLQVVGHPTLSEDERTIVFAADFANGQGGKDLYIATRESKGDDFKRPRNLGPIVNTEGDEMYPYLRNDSTLYFSSNGHVGIGGLDIYKVKILGDTVAAQQVDNMSAPINSVGDDFGIIFDPTQQEAGYMTSTRSGGRGGADIYAFVLPPLEYTISGTVTDNYTKQIIDRMPVVLIGSDGSTKQSKTLPDGHFEFNKMQVKPDTDYELLFEKNKYFRKIVKLSTVGIDHSEDLTADVAMQPVPNKPILLPEILFDLGKWDLKPQFEDSLRGLIETMDANPKIVIELGAHTDARGAAEANDILSQKRAESVVKYLIMRGIDQKRLFAKGYGEQVPRSLYEETKKNGYTFPADTELTEDYIASLSGKQQETAHSMNRRIEFRIVGKDYQKRALAEQQADSLISIGMGNTANQVMFVSPGRNLYEMPCLINGYNEQVIYTPMTKLNTCSVDFALKLLTEGTIKKEDFKGNADDLISTGNIVHKSVFTLKNFRIGSKTIRNIDVYVWHGSTYPFIINELTIKKFGKPNINKDTSTIIFEK